MPAAHATSPVTTRSTTPITVRPIPSTSAFQRRPRRGAGSTRVHLKEYPGASGPGLGAALGQEALPAYTAAVRRVPVPRTAGGAETGSHTRTHDAFALPYPASMGGPGSGPRNLAPRSGTPPRAPTHASHRDDRTDGAANGVRLSCPTAPRGPPRRLTAMPFASRAISGRQPLCRSSTGGGSPRQSTSKRSLPTHGQPRVGTLPPDPPSPKNAVPSSEGGARPGASPVARSGGTQRGRASFRSADSGGIRPS